MLYMFLAAPSVTAGGLAAGGAAMAAAGARIPTFALLLAVALFGYVIWTTDRLTSLARPRSPSRQQPGPCPRRGHVAASRQALAGRGHRCGGRPGPGPDAPAMSLRLAAASRS